MNKSIIDILRCPRCSSTKLILNVDKEIGFQILKGKIYCPICQISYQIKEGIPIMLLPDQYEVTKRQQKIDIFDNEKNDEEEIERPHCNGVLYKYLIDYKMKKNITAIRPHLEDKTIVITACGSGMDAEYWANWGYRVVATDISTGLLLRAKERARRKGIKLELVTAAGENLPFKTGFASYGFVHDGLHHMEQPYRAIYELWRCAKYGVLINEPSDALITRIAVKLGISEEFEEGIDYVYRFHPSELKRLFKALGAQKTRMSRYIMWYPHSPNSLFRVFDKAGPYFVFRLAFNVINAMFNKFGNKLWFIAEKSDKINQFPRP